ncbi:MAG: Outer membrane protein assembly factor BamB [bacterium ADurb.Bin374]|nr:MAG: Outer membrane protein assembly factor BamB [bacterium ADurb.Bin374]
MSLRSFSLVLIVCGILAYVLYSSEPPTSEIWKIKAAGEVTTQPAEVGSRSVFLIRQQQIAAIDLDGTITGPVQLDAQARHPLVGIASGVLVSDREGGYAFYSPTLTRLWKRGTLTPSDLQPVDLPGNRLVVAGAPDVLFGLEGTTGEAVWESHFDGRVTHVVPDETIAVVYGYDDLKKPSWKICAIDPEDGSVIWKHPDAVGDDAPVVYSNYFIFCDKDGRPIAVDQQTGKVFYKHDSDGYRIAGITGSSLLLLAAGGTRMDYCDLPTGTSWSVTLPSPFLGALAVDGALLFADGRSVRCIEARTGVIRWQRDLGKTFDWFVHENTLGITYKDNFLARHTRVTLFTPDRNQTVWTAMDSGRFYKPMKSTRGDLLVCRSGNVRLMPYPELAPGPEAIATETVASTPERAFFTMPPVATSSAPFASATFPALSASAPSAQRGPEESPLPAMPASGKLVPIASPAGW